MIRSLAAISLLVPDYDEGVAFFERALGFTVEKDIPLGGDKRWVVVAPPGGAGARIVLAVPSDERQRERIGDQTGGRVGYFLLTDAFQEDYAAMQARGVTFVEAPRSERYGTVAVFVDPWGGKWDLLQPSGASENEASSAHER
jgi:putative peptidoglycan lipid II flippase